MLKTRQPWRTWLGSESKMKEVKGANNAKKAKIFT
jgi:hypothetical protein